MSNVVADPAREPNRVVVICLAVLVTAFVHLRSWATGSADGLPLDSDGWVRLLRVDALREGAGWFTTLLPHLAAPEGLDIHWTRPFDLLILLPAWALSTLGAHPDTTLLIAGALICPVLHLASVLAAGWAAREAWPGMAMAPLYAGLMLLGQPILTNYSAFGRTDHHTLIVLCVILGLGALLRALRPGAGASVGYASGAAFGVGIWVGPETLIVAMPALLALGLWWLLSGAGAAAATLGRRIATGMTAIILLAVLVERAPASWAVIEYDKVSVHHLLLATLMAAVFFGAGIFSRLPRFARLLAGGALSVAAAALLLILNPGALGTSLSGADPESAAMLLPLVDEMQPIRPFDRAGLLDLGIYAGIALPALIATGWILIRPGDDAARPRMLVLMLTTLVCLAGTLAARRLSLDLAAVAAVASAGLIGLIAERVHHASLRLGAVLLAAPLLFGPSLLSLVPAPSAGISAEGQGQEQRALTEGCRPRDLASWFTSMLPTGQRRGTGPVMMVSDVDKVAELAWRTPFRFVASVYHRNGAALRETLRVFYGTDEAAIRDILTRRGVSYVLVCRHDATSDGLFTRRLLDGTAPAWMAEVAPPEGIRTSGARLFAIR